MYLETWEVLQRRRHSFAWREPQSREDVVCPLLGCDIVQKGCYRLSLSLPQSELAARECLHSWAPEASASCASERVDTYSHHPYDMIGTLSPLPPSLLFPPEQPPHRPSGGRHGSAHVERCSGRCLLAHHCCAVETGLVTRLVGPSGGEESGERGRGGRGGKGQREEGR